MSEIHNRLHHLGAFVAGCDDKTPGLAIPGWRRLHSGHQDVLQCIIGDGVALEAANAAPVCYRFAGVRDGRLRVPLACALRV